MNYKTCFLKTPKKITKTFENPVEILLKQLKLKLTKTFLS